ncbi:MAG: hypothetical protein EAZ66_04340, partial [Alphaproteobacteria bacterium]
TVATTVADTKTLTAAYAVVNGKTINGDGNLTITEGTLSVTEANDFANNLDGIVTAELTVGFLASFANLIANETDNAFTITVEDDSGDTLQATALSTLGGKTTGTVTVQNAVIITGTATQLMAALVDTETQVLAQNAHINFTNAPTVAQFAAIRAQTVGTLTYTSIADTAANLNADALSVTPVISNKVVTVTDSGAVDASHLVAISSKTTSNVTVGAASTIQGVAADLVSVINDAGISKSGSVAFNVNSGTATVAQATIINGAVTSGTKTFSIVDGSAIQTASSAVLAAATSVTYNGTDTPNTMDMSAYTLSNLTINANEGNDTVYGSGGNDTINGGSGADRIYGRGGNDVINGGTGVDTFVFNSTAANNGHDSITVSLSSGLVQDVFDFGAFIETGSVNQNNALSTAVAAFQTTDTANTNIADDVVLLNTAGVDLSLEQLAALI